METEYRIIFGRRFHCVGDCALLGREKLALICPRKCPADKILEFHEKFKEWAGNPAITVVSGFHSPLEKDCFELLLDERASMIWIPARSIEKMRLKERWQLAIGQNRLLIISPFKERRMSRKTCELRNEIVKLISEKENCKGASSS